MPSRIASVGFVGAGPATQAIHLPTLARLPDRFDVTRVNDVDLPLAESVARRVNATAVHSLPEMLERDAPDVVVICSPNSFHAEQVIAACRARVGAVLCEKPLATSTAEAEAIARASRKTGVPVIVGTMHGFDPVWTMARQRWADLDEAAHTVRISAHIPPNPVTEDFATEVVGRPEPGTAAPAEPSRADRIARLRGGVLGLAIHDLPLARKLLPNVSPVVRMVHEPAAGGYLILADVGGAMLEVRGGSSRNWLPDWHVEAIADDGALVVRFGPSYVHAGSATANLTVASAGAGFTTTQLGPTTDNGYLRQWQLIDEVLHGRATAPALDTLVSDLDFATRLADQAVALLPERPAMGMSA